MINITVNGEKKPAEENLSLREALERFTPYGEEATIVVYNGKAYKSIDLEDDAPVLTEGDDINIVPLIIGG